MSGDMTVPCENGYINIRAGAIILKDGKFLMAGSAQNEYLYSVGGRVQFGETAEQAVIREVLEETGVKMEIDRLGFIHENYFISDLPKYFGKTIYEISFYFYMKVPADFSLKDNTFQDDGTQEFLKWISPNDNVKFFPAFFKAELLNPKNYVQHFVTDSRK